MKPSVDRFAVEYMAKLRAGDQNPESRGMLEESFVPVGALAAQTLPTAHGVEP
jgi:hypothetical protein